MAQTDQSIDTLVSISGTMASIGLALVGIVSAKASLSQTETIVDDLFLFSSLGFLFVLVLGYWVQKGGQSKRINDLVSAAEWTFSAALLTILLGAFLLVYTEV